jgi:hypothetical protein
MSSQEFDISGIKAVMAIPMHDGKIVAECLEGIIEAVQLSYKYNFVLELVYVKGSSLVQVARNELIGKWYQIGIHNKVIWIDADIGFKGEDLIRLLALSTHYPVIGGIYPLKNPKIQFKATPFRTNGKVILNKHGLIPMVSMPLGFSVIDKLVFDTLRPTVAKFSRTDGEELDEFFKVYVEDGRVWGEDIDFCKQVYSNGGSVWCDPSIKLKHIGDYAYEGDYLQSL